MKKLIGQTIMHHNCKDVAFWVSNVSDRTVIGYWLNLGYDGKPWILDEMKDSFYVSNEDAWFVITSGVERRRREDGLPHGTFLSVRNFLS